MKTEKIKLPLWVKTGFLVALSVIIGSSAVFFHLQKRAMLSRAEERLSAISRLKADQINAWRQDQLDNGAEFMNRPFLVERLNQWLLNPQEPARIKLLTELTLIRRQKKLINVLIVDPNGAIRLNLAGPVEESDNYASELVAAFSKRMAVMTDLHEDSQDPKPHLSIIAPLFADHIRTQPIGAVILMIDPSEYLYPFIQSWPIPSQSAETLLVRRDGNDVLFLNTLRHKGNTALKLRIPLSRLDLPAAMAIKGVQGVVIGKDYRGEKVVAVLTPVKDSSWFMVAKVDEDEIFRDWRPQAYLILGLIVSALIILGLLALFAWQQAQKKHYLVLLKAEKDLFNSEEKYRDLVETANSAIIRWSVDGTITFFNEYAQSFFGWSAEEVVGRHVGILLPEQESTGADLTSLIRDIVEQPEHYSNYINQNVCRDGRRVWMTWTNRPVHDEQGRLTGILAVGSDITALKDAETALRASEAKYRNLFENMTEEVHFWQLIRDKSGRIKTWRLVDVNPPALKSWGRKTVAEIRGKTTDEIFGPGATEHHLPVVQKIMTEGVPHAFEDYFPHLDKYFRFTSVPLGDYFITTGADITAIKKTENAIRRQYELLKAINRIFEAVVTSAGDEAFGTACLAVAEKITGSTISFIGEIGPDGLTHDIAISNPAWQACAMYDEQGEPKPPGNFHIHGIYGSVLNQGTTLLTNDPASHPDRIGLPPGHPPLRSFLGTPLKQQDKTIGMIAVGNRENGYGAQEKEALETIAPVICEALARRRAEEALKVSLAEKEVLLKEIHHRVKNNLQVISSLVDLQADEVQDAAMRHIFQDVIYRVHSMAMVHEKLYQSTDFARVEFADYARSLLSYLYRAQRTAITDVELELDLEPVLLPVNEAVPCGLMLNELFTNSLRHAFVNRHSGKVSVALRSDMHGKVSLTVQDNGIGLPADMDIKKSRSLGLRLVQMLARQLHASVEVQSDKETKFIITFEVPKS